MSRIGKQPVIIPDTVKVTVNGDTVLVEGPKRTVSKLFAPVVKVTAAAHHLPLPPPAPRAPRAVAAHPLWPGVGRQRGAVRRQLGAAAVTR